MNDDVTDLRKGDRFLVAEAVEGTFGATPVALLNMSLGGAQLLHAQPLRIGTRAMLTFRHAGEGASVNVIVVWSHLSQTAEGLRYHSGVKLDAPDVSYARALNAFVRAGIAKPDKESLERKRQREMEKEQRRKSSPKISLPLVQ
ncbi:MAG TPA: PilZ domain-containing protein [Thermoanaerobaculia bacterium]|nr:PilZ domain-containing protein [Thermoanaerobaculia bacterium]